MEEGAISLLYTVFSWSLTDVLNKNYYKDKVKRIPEVFSSATHYTTSFKAPLIEETRTSLCSGLESLGHSPACEITNIEELFNNRQPRRDLYYEILTEEISGFKNPGGHYDPEGGDFVVLTKNTKPRKLDDLTKYGSDFVFAFIKNMEEDSDTTRILVSKKIDSDFFPSHRRKVFVTYLMNLTTNMRIWRGLHPDPQGTNLKLILKVLTPGTNAGEDCTICVSRTSTMLTDQKVLGMISSFGLDESQKNAVLSSIAMRKCNHEDGNVKLIWGPPGTGKTKTVASLLFLLFRLKCRTLACAPTNIAILQVAKRLTGLVKQSLEYDTYGFGDIIVFGNGERMKVIDKDEILDVFLDYRAAIISKCLSPFNGWKSTLTSMISLLEDPKMEHRLYLDNNEDEKSEDKDDTNVKGKCKRKGLKKNGSEYWKGVVNQSLKGTSMNKDGYHGKITIFEDYVVRRFDSIRKRLAFFMKNLYTHFPTSIIELAVVENMIKLLELLELLEDKKGRNDNEYTWTMKREELLQILKSLPEEFQIPVSSSSEIQEIKNFCLMNANLIFCTASSSAKMLPEGMKPVEMVIIDEAAQLKECESMIPFQIPGLRNTILIGDDKQLPAMVQSKVAEKADFGRSLFERLGKLDQKKHLLNIQYRMHPSVSLFPNTKFYQKQIVDGPNVKKASYKCCFLKGRIYGSYSFIDVARGKEDFERGHSPRNLVESAVIDKIIAKLFVEFTKKKKMVSIGVVSPYKGQVDLIQETLGKKYSNYIENGFLVSVRSVDGFQGGEEDVIIISTVRSNGNGTVGFLSNLQRTNVALTRARYCLWILGNANTLVKSESVWRDLVVDAQTRGCFYNADEDKDLELAMYSALEDKLDGTFNLDSFNHSLGLRKSRWKVVLTDGFRNSMSEIKSNETQKQVVKILEKLADGWRDPTLLHAMGISGLPKLPKLLQLYKIDEQFSLAWTIDVVKEKSKYTQVIKVWDVLTVWGIRKLVQKLDILFSSYTLDTIDRCERKFFEGNFAVPKTWDIGSILRSGPDNFQNAYIRDNDEERDSFPGRFSDLNLRGNKEESSSKLEAGNNDGVFSFMSRIIRNLKQMVNL